ncbi:MAG: hypothetical protein JEZ11_02155 [Desulfobacterales bacterium]|nr:hypothetical protein [Desulfobacterales bacterium]
MTLSTLGEYINERLRLVGGLLVRKRGLCDNVLCIKPPLCIPAADVDFIVAVLDVAHG